MQAGSPQVGGRAHGCPAQQKCSHAQARLQRQDCTGKAAEARLRLLKLKAESCVQRQDCTCPGGRPTCRMGRGMALNGPTTSLHTSTSALALMLPAPALPPLSPLPLPLAEPLLRLTPLPLPLPAGCQVSAAWKYSTNRSSSPSRCSSSLPFSLHSFNGREV